MQIEMTEKNNEGDTSIRISKEVHAQLEAAKKLTLNSSFTKLFEELMPFIRDYSLQYFCTVGDVLFKGKPWKPIDLSMYKIAGYPATESDD